MPKSLPVPNGSITSSVSSGSEIDYMQNIKAMLEKSAFQISRDGNSQLQRLINNIDSPEKTKPMKAVSLGELNTVDLYFIIVAILERRIITCEEQNEILKKSLKKALKKIAKLEDLIRSTEEPRKSPEMPAHSKASTS